jgi:IS30 family transposase
VAQDGIFRAVYVQSRGELRTRLGAALRHRGDPAVSIVTVSPDADPEALPGHWESDLLLGPRGRSAVATLVERRTRFGILLQLDEPSVPHVAERIRDGAVELPAHVTYTLTREHGHDLDPPVGFRVSADAPVHFCHPATPWQSGRNENWNALVREFLPTGTDLSVPTQAELDEIAALLNGRPRQTLGWETPAERLHALMSPAP